MCKLKGAYLKKGELKNSKEIKIDHLYYKTDKWNRVSKRAKQIIFFSIYLAILIISLEIVNSNMIRSAFASNANEKVKKLINKDKEELIFTFYKNIIGDQKITYFVLKYAKENHLEPSLLTAVIKTESNFNTQAISYNVNGSIDRGLCQLNDLTFPEIHPDAFFDPEINIQSGAKFLKWCLSSSNNNIVKALAYYNAGIGNVSKKNISETTLNYINKVISEKKRIDDEYERFITTY